MTPVRLPLTALLLLVLSLSCFAADPGSVVYRGGGEGKVTFSHHLHARKGFVCLDCHTAYRGTGKQLFQTRKQGLITIANHGSEVQCFACHNDKVAFSKCDQCHRK